MFDRSASSSWFNLRHDKILVEWRFARMFSYVILLCFALVVKEGGHMEQGNRELRDSSELSTISRSKRALTAPISTG